LDASPEAAVIPVERPETLAMVWPTSQAAPSPPQVAGYHVALDFGRAEFVAVQAAIGFDVTPAAWAQLTQRRVGGALVWRGSEPVAAACGERQADGTVELGWVAVAPAHRDRDLGHLVCAALTAQLVDAHVGVLHGSTHDHRLAALSIYFKVGFWPVHRPEKSARWRAACGALGVRFEPGRWGWPESA
jgi:hypothetical protein